MPEKKLADLPDDVTVEVVARRAPDLGEQGDEVLGVIARPVAGELPALGELHASGAVSGGRQRGAEVAASD